jgi:hypothetical protein
MTVLVFLLLGSLFLATADKGYLWVRVEGEITSIDPVEEQIVVDGKTVQVTEDTKIVQEQEEITFNDLELDMMVRVRGLVKNDVIIAQHIRVKCECTELEGEITSIDPVELTLVVDNVTVQVTKDTIIKMKTQLITFEDLKVGQTVKVCGTMDNDVLVAKKICVKYGGR